MPHPGALPGRKGLGSFRRGKVTYFFETPPMKIILFSRAQIAHTPEEIRQLIGTI